MRLVRLRDVALADFFKTDEIRSIIVRVDLTATQDQEEVRSSLWRISGCHQRDRCKRLAV
jgi:hypothetical protein